MEVTTLAPQKALQMPPSALPLAWGSWAMVKGLQQHLAPSGQALAQLRPVELTAWEFVWEPVTAATEALPAAIAAPEA